jgi:hypothetical protein
MCFSAGASFTAGAVLSATGVVTLTRVKKPSMRLFSLLPLIFGVQQLAEGFVWITLNNPGHDTAQKVFMYIFLVIADVIWPTLIPGSMLVMEPDAGRRKIMRIFLISGMIVSAYYAVCLSIFSVNPEIVNCHIFYAGTYVPALMIPAFLLYLISTLTPLFLSSVRGMKWFGAAMFISVLVTVVFYIRNVTSVWCFFAAILSIMILLIIRKENPRTA